MRVIFLEEHGLENALMGLSLSRGHGEDYRSGRIDMLRVAQKLAPLDGGHNKFLESIVVWIYVSAPRYWWQEMDTYRVGMTKQSASSMDLILKRRLVPEDFEEGDVDTEYLEKINGIISGDIPESRKRVLVKRMLPEAYLQDRVLCTNYKTLRNVYHQRRDHRLPEWHKFLDCVVEKLEHPEFITSSK